MNDLRKTKAQLAFEVQQLRERVAELEAAETTRRHMAAELQTAEARWRSLVQAAPVRVTLVDRDGIILFINHTEQGRTAQGVIGTSVFNYLPAGVHSLIRQMITSVLETSCATSYEVEIPRPDGRTVWYENHAGPLEQGGTISGVIFISLDITARKQAEAALTDSEQSFQTLFDTLTEGIALNEIIYDDHGDMIDYRIVKVNPAFYAIADFVGHDVVGKTATQVYGLSSDFIQAFWQAHRTERVTMHTEMRSPLSGKFFFIATSPFVDNQFVTSFIDITDRKRAEDALRTSEDRYRTILEETPVGFFQSTPAGRYLAVNPALAHMLGYDSPAELVDSITDMATQVHVNPARRQDFMRIMAEQGEVREYVNQNYRKDGRRIHTLTNARAVRDQAGEVLYYEGFMTDITERVRAEDALRESQETFALFMRHSPIYAFIKSVTPIESRVLQASENYQQMIGLAGSEMTGKTMQELFPPEFAAKISADDWAVVAKGEVLKLDEELNGRNYTTIKFPIVRGDKTLLAGYTIDITERTRAEERLRDSERRLKQAESAVHLGYYELDLQTGAALWSDETFRLFGLDPAAGEPTIETYRQLIHPDDVDLLYQRLAESIETHQRFDLTYRIQIAGGGQRYVHSLGDIHVGADNRLKMFGTLQDVTERVLAGEAAQHFAFIANSAAELMTLVNPQHIIEAANDAYCRVVNRPRDQIIGRSLAEVWSEARYHEKILPRLHDCFSGHIVQYEESFTVDGETPRHYQVGMYPYAAAADGPVAYVAIITVDVTERVRAEAALRELNTTLEERVADRTRQLAAVNDRLAAANAQLSDLDRLKDEFISRISHELRTPLTSIKIYLELLDVGKPEKRAKYMQVLNEQTLRLQRLIESLLDVTQKSINADDLRLVPVDLNSLAASLAADAAARAAQRGLTLTSALQPALPFASADGVLLSQALSNLVTNALNYTPAGGAVELNTHQVIENGDSWIAFSVRDTGPGIAPDDLPHIFDRFYRGRAAADYKTPGAGLGLAVSRDVLAALGGRLTVDSQPGTGATFTAWLRPA